MWIWYSIKNRENIEFKVKEIFEMYLKIFKNNNLDN